MRIIIYFSLVILLGFYGCKREEAVPFKELSSIRFTHKLLDEIPVKIKIDGTLFQDKTLEALDAQSAFLLDAGIHQFLFLDENDQILLDTMLSVNGPSYQYGLFRPDEMSPVTFLNEQALGLDTVTTPKQGFFKVKIGNFSEEKIDLVLGAITNPNRDVVIFHTLSDLGRDFSDYYELPANGTVDNGVNYRSPLFGAQTEVSKRDYEEGWLEEPFFRASFIGQWEAGKIYVLYLKGQEADFMLYDLYKK